MSEKLLVPDIGEFENVEVIEILVKSGDQIKKNDPLITIESDKSSVEIPSTIDGKIESIGLNVGDKVSKGDLILNYLSSTKTSMGDTLPKDTENIIKQAEQVIADKKEKEKEIKNIIPEKKQSIIQVSNGIFYFFFYLFIFIFLNSNNFFCLFNYTFCVLWKCISSC